MLRPAWHAGLQRVPHVPSQKDCCLCAWRDRCLAGGKAHPLRPTILPSTGAVNDCSYEVPSAAVAVKLLMTSTPPEVVGGLATDTVKGPAKLAAEPADAPDAPAGPAQDHGH